jgi:RHS repeat-associated protein
MPFDGLTSHLAINRSLRAPGIVTAWPRPRKGGSGSHAIALSGDGGRVEPGGPERAGRKEYTNTRHFTYSASGNMLTDDRVMNGAVAVSNTFGGRNRLESMTVGTPTITFKINALGERVQKAVTGATTDYQFDLDGHIIGESNDSNAANIVEYVFMGILPLAQIDSGGNIFYIHSNQVDAPQKMTNASRTIVWDFETEPFGETYATPTNTTPTNHRFPGQYADAEDLLSYNLMRDYDPTIGRYIESDRIGFRGGLNLFGYAGQNPTQGIDPDGHLTLLQVVSGIALAGILADVYWDTKGYYKHHDVAPTPTVPQSPNECQVPANWYSPGFPASSQLQSFPATTPAVQSSEDGVEPVDLHEREEEKVRQQKTQQETTQPIESEPKPETEVP